MCNVLRQGATFILAAFLLGSMPPFVFAQGAGVSVSTVLEALEKGQNAAAIGMCDELLRKDPKSFTAWTLRALGLERSGQSKEALVAYRRALILAPDFMAALEGAAQLEYKAQSVQALPLLRHILVLQPANPTAHAMLGVLEYRQQDYTNAGRDFAAAGAALDAQPDALLAYAICLDHLKRAPEAIASFQHLVALEPMNLAPRYDLALVQWRSATSAEALATLQPLLEAPAADSRILRLAAAIHEADGETPQAIELLRSAIRDDPDEPNNYVDFATLAFAHRSYAVGIDLVSRGLARIPNSAALYMARGVLYGQNGDFDKAMSDFEHAHQLDPNYSMAATAEGIAQSQQHNHDAALKDFRRQVQDHPKDALGYYLLAEALSWAPPEENRSDPSGGMKEAISMAMKSVELDPSLVQAWDLLGSLYLQNDQPNQAANACRTAIKLMPKDQKSVYTLILALRKTGSREELKNLVQTLTELRKEEGTEARQKERYGRLIEGQ
jgi:tetratricopeptide (TPR) repeat protein